MSALALLAGTLIDRVVGDPPGLWRRVPHPVVLFGAAIGACDRRWNRTDRSPSWRRRAGVLTVLLLTLSAILAGLALEALFLQLGALGLVLQALVIAVLLAQRSLAEHVRAVERGLGRSLEEGRAAVSMIVGRDPNQLDRPAICRAAIESLAENTSDGVVAPFLYAAIFGLPGILAYKMVNTADSMIGHLDDRYRHFGWAAARLDDVLNWLPARASAAAFALLSRSRAAWQAARRDGPQHRSVNAGWPEGAMAGALGLALGGPRRYGTLVVDAPLINATGRRDATLGDIAQALRLFRRLCNLLLALALVLVLIALG